MPGDGVEIVLRAEGIHDIVYHVVLAHTTRQPVDTQPPISAAKIRFCVP